MLYPVELMAEEKLRGILRQASAHWLHARAQVWQWS